MAELSTQDALLGGRVRLVQPQEGYRAAIDPVLLAAAVGARPGDAVLDAGAGTGAAALCLAARLPGCRIHGLERDPKLVALAREALALVAPPPEITFHLGDLADPPAAIRALDFDHVMTNPPYLLAERTTPPPEAGRRAAHVESLDLAEWLAACRRRLRPGGWLTLIHRADRLPEILAALLPGCGDIGIFPLWPRAAAPAARRVVVRARKGGRGPATLSKGLVLHEDDGRFTAAAEAILRRAEPLPWP
jgi:tRNA1(Val) A37 N6-methylase TrmN6